MEAKVSIPTGRRELWPLVLILLAPLPGFVAHLANLWWGKSHYQFFPLLLVGFGILFWQRRPRTLSAAVPSRLSPVFWGGGLSVLIASVLITSPWLAASAMLLALAGVLFRLYGSATWRDWLPTWCLLWLLIPPPLGWDYRFLQRLQSLTSRASSLVLDACGVPHLMEGNVLVFPGRHLPVEQASSGVNSPFVLLTVAALFVVAARRPPLLCGLVLVASIVWSVLGNVVRVVAVAVAHATYGLDWSIGWRYELLGLGSFVFVLLMVISTDQLLAFLLGPIVFFSPDEPDDDVDDDTADIPDSPCSAWDLRRNPLTRVWNWAAGLRLPSANPGPADKASTSALECRPAASGSGRVSRWFAAGFVAVAIVQGATRMIPVAFGDDAPDVAPPLKRGDVFKRTDLPTKLADWIQVNHATEEHEAFAVTTEHESSAAREPVHGLFVAARQQLFASSGMGQRGANP